MLLLLLLSVLSLLPPGACCVSFHNAVRGSFSAHVLDKLPPGTLFTRWNRQTTSHNNYSLINKFQNFEIPRRGTNTRRYIHEVLLRGVRKVYAKKILSAFRRTRPLTRDSIMARLLTWSLYENEYYQALYHNITHNFFFKVIQICNYA